MRGAGVRGAEAARVYRLHQARLREEGKGKREVRGGEARKRCRGGERGGQGGAMKREGGVALSEGAVPRGRWRGEMGWGPAPPHSLLYLR